MPESVSGASLTVVLRSAALEVRLALKRFQLDPFSEMCVQSVRKFEHRSPNVEHEFDSRKQPAPTLRTPTSYRGVVRRFV